MKSSLLWTGLAAGAIGAGLWARSRRGEGLPLLDPPEVPLLVPGRVVVERVLGGDAGGAPLPLVLALHGVGADETQLGPHILVDRPVRVVFLRAPLVRGQGFEWFPARLRGEGKAFGPQLAQAAAGALAVLDAIAAQRAVARTIVLGYSQGAHIAWWLATTGRVDHVVAVAGAVPQGLTVPRARWRVPIEAAHGTRDPVVPFAAGKATAEHFEAAGYKVRFTPVRLAGHGLAHVGDAIAPMLRVAL